MNKPTAFFILLLTFLNMSQAWSKWPNGRYHIAHLNDVYVVATESCENQSCAKAEALHGAKKYCQWIGGVPLLVVGESPQVLQSTLYCQQTGCRISARVICQFY